MRKLFDKLNPLIFFSTKGRITDNTNIAQTCSESNTKVMKNKNPCMNIKGGMVEFELHTCITGL